MIAPPRNFPEINTEMKFVKSWTAAKLIISFTAGHSDSGQEQRIFHASGFEKSGRRSINHAD
jgi:hypothetical protein